MYISNFKAAVSRLTAGFCILALMLSFSTPASADPVLNLASEAAVVIDADTGRVLYEKNMHRQLYPASITKVMTGMLALKYLNPEETLTVSQAAVNAVPSTSSHISLEPGEELTFEQTMLALSMMSANDAANVLGEAISGSLEAFGRKMTEEAHELGAVNTHFTNANGLPDSEHYTTAYDMALITAAAVKTPGFANYFSTLEYDFLATNMHRGVRHFSNKNQILNGPYRYEGVLMSKTGWTSSAQGTLVTAARQGDTTLVAVVLKSVMLTDKYEDTRKLLDYGFSHYRLTPVSGEAVAAQLACGDYNPVPNQSFSFLLGEDESPEDVTFTLADGMDLTNAADQTAVIVHASMGDAPLQDCILILIKPGVEPDPTFAAAFFAQQTEPEPSEPAGNGEPQITAKQWAIGIGCVLAYIVLRVSYIRRRERAHRKRRLEGRIRMMKKQMEE